MPRVRRANIGRRTRHASQQQVYLQKLSEEQQNIIRENARLSQRLSTRRSLASYNRLAFQYDPTTNYSDHDNLDIRPMTTVCRYCNAIKFKRDTAGLCCASGKVKLDPLLTPLQPLKPLFDGTDPDSNHFLQCILEYNNCFRMTSFGANIIREGGFMPTCKEEHRGPADDTKNLEDAGNDSDVLRTEVGKKKQTKRNMSSDDAYSNAMATGVNIIIARVYNFFKSEYEYLNEKYGEIFDVAPFSQYKERTSEATGFDVDVVSRALEELEIQDGGAKKQKLNLNDSQSCEDSESDNDEDCKYYIELNATEDVCQPSKQPEPISNESTKASTTEVQTITSRKRKKSNAQKCREYRERKKLHNTMVQNITAETDQLPAKKPKTDPERRKKYYEAQKLKKQKIKKIPKTAKQRNKECYHRKKKLQALNTLNHHSDVMQFKPTADLIIKVENDDFEGMQEHSLDDDIVVKEEIDIGDEKIG